MRLLAFVATLWSVLKPSVDSALACPHGGHHGRLKCAMRTLARIGGLILVAFAITVFTAVFLIAAEKVALDLWSVVMKKWSLSGPNHKATDDDWVLLPYTFNIDWCEPVKRGVEDDLIVGRNFVARRFPLSGERQ